MVLCPYISRGSDLIRAVYIWKCSACNARLRVLAEIEEEGPTQRTMISCPVWLRKKNIEGRTVRIFMDSDHDRTLDILAFLGDDKTPN